MYIVTCRGVIIRRGIYWMIGFTATLYTPLDTTSNYSATANLHARTHIHTSVRSLLHSPLVISWKRIL
jgi:hypothetical protein